MGNTAMIEELGKLLDLHRLALADAVNVPQRPKGEDYGETFFLLMQMLRKTEQLDLAQVSFFIRDRLVVCFQSCADDLFEPVRRRLREARGPLRSTGADYLAYALIDCVLDSYFPLLERYGDRLDSLEREVISGEELEGFPEAVHELKHDLFIIRRILWPQRDAVAALRHDDSHYLTDATRLYLRDAIDHINQLLDLVEAHHEFSAGLMSLHQAFMTQRANDIMKILTMLASIFIPLTFIVGIYGMNFDPDSSPWNMPELRSYWGYPAVMAFMAVVVLVMLFMFHRKGWIGRRRKPAAVMKRESEMKTTLPPGRPVAED
jgi:magnesium transporter